MKILLVAPTEEHVEELASNMRDGDRLECLAGYSDPRPAIWDSLALAEKAWTGVLPTGEVVFIGGVSSSGRVFILSTNVVTKYPLEYIRITRELLRRVAKEMGCLVGYIDCRYKATLRWAKWLGFELDTQHPIPVGLDQVEFIPCRYGGVAWAS